jgi:hypothetical protein
MAAGVTNNILSTNAMTAQNSIQASAVEYVNGAQAAAAQNIAKINGQYQLAIAKTQANSNLWGSVIGGVTSLGSAALGMPSLGGSKSSGTASTQTNVWGPALASIGL